MYGMEMYGIANYEIIVGCLVISAIFSFVMAVRASLENHRFRKHTKCVQNRFSDILFALDLRVKYLESKLKISLEKSCGPELYKPFKSCEATLSPGMMKQIKDVSQGMPFIALDGTLITLSPDMMKQIKDVSQGMSFKDCKALDGTLIGSLLNLQDERQKRIKELEEFIHTPNLLTERRDEIQKELNETKKFIQSLMPADEHQ